MSRGDHRPRSILHVRQERAFVNLMTFGPDVEQFVIGRVHRDNDSTGVSLLQVFQKDLLGYLGEVGHFHQATNLLEEVVLRVQHLFSSELLGPVGILVWVQRVI